MSQIAILSDIHANLHALKAVLRDVQNTNAKKIVFLGDTVGYGATPAECVEWVRKLGGWCVMGNHDVALESIRKHGEAVLGRDWEKCGYRAGLMHAVRSLNEEQLDWLGKLPYRMEIPGGVCAHGSWDQPEEFNYIEDEESAAPTLIALSDLDEPVGFFGHTHAQKAFAGSKDRLEWLSESMVRIPIGTACAVTVGSVGQPRDPMDRRAEWVLWDPSDGVVEFRKTEYDRKSAADAIARKGLPMESAMRLLSDRDVESLFN